MIQRACLSASLSWPGSKHNDPATSGGIGVLQWLPNSCREALPSRAHFPSAHCITSLMQGLLRESQLANERLQKEYNVLTEKVARLHHTLEEHVHTNTQLLADNSQRQVEIKAKEDEIRALRVRRLQKSCIAGFGPS